MYYFLKHRKLHRYPVPDQCGTAYNNEKLWDYQLRDVEQCIYCLRRWPGDDQ